MVVEAATRLAVERAADLFVGPGQIDLGGVLGEQDDGVLADALQGGATVGGEDVVGADLGVVEEAVGGLGLGVSVAEGGMLRVGWALLRSSKRRKRASRRASPRSAESSSSMTQGCKPSFMARKPPDIGPGIPGPTFALAVVSSRYSNDNPLGNSLFVWNDEGLALARPGPARLGATWCGVTRRGRQAKDPEEGEGHPLGLAVS
jgi:hypothetical protein